MLNYAAQQWSADLVFPLLSKLAFAKVFVPCGFSALDNWKWRPYFWLMPRVLRSYDAVVYLSDAYRDKAFGDRHGIAHFEVIGNGAPEEQFRERRAGFRHKYGIDTRRMVLSASNFGPMKNQQFVLEAFRRAAIREATLVFIGSEMNEYARSLESASTGVSNVKVLAGVSREDLVAAYGEADLFLFGSRIECFPLVVLEAMASRTAFISTDVGCVAALPGGVVVRNAEDMAHAVRRLVADDSAREQLASAGRAAWEGHYTWTHIVDQYEDLYRRLTKRERQP
jgi:glycosyltransferase involved in cell wall biosynthesis